MKYLVLTTLLSCALGTDLDVLDGERRNIGGYEVEPNSVPFQVSLQRRVGTEFIHFCGGIIYNEYWIISAAHCVYGVGAAVLRIVAGEHDLSKRSGLEQYRDVDLCIVHGNFSASLLHYDIALIRVTSALILNKLVSSITLPQQYEEVADGTTLVVSGWGISSSHHGPSSDQLKSVQVPYVNDITCEKSYVAGSIIPSMICAGDLANGGADSCQGDSGGPLFTTDVPPKLVGIVSTGHGCALAGYPGVYTQTSYFVTWIEANVS